MNTATTDRFARSRRISSLMLAAGMLFASSCSLPFADEGEDISAEVGVGGVAASDTIKSADVRGDLDDADAEPALDQSTDDGNDDTEAPAPTTAPQDDTGTLTPYVEVDSRFDGRSVDYLGIDIQLGDFIVTNQTLQQYAQKAEPTEDERILIVEVAVTNTGNGTIMVPEGVFGIELANGERVAPSDMRQPDGGFISTVQPPAQATERIVLVFADIDLTGASFVVSEGPAIPQFIPLDPTIPVAAPYVMELPGQPAVTGLRAPSVWDGCLYTWTGEMTGARILLEGVENDRLLRADKGTRWLAVEMRATNNTPSGDEFYPCNSVGVGHRELNARLRIDGFAMSSTNYQSIGARIDEDVTDTVEFWFPISVDTTTAELTDVNGTIIASWTFDLPAVPGES